MPTSSKFHLTQSLLSSWQHGLESPEKYESFIKALNRQKEPPSPAMLAGRQFENCINGYLDGNPVPDKVKYRDIVIEIGDFLAGSQQQVEEKKDILVDGVCFELDGIADFVRAGVIYDTKFSKKYYLNKYLSSPQHPMYFYLMPEAYEFQYIISNGRDIFREIYRPEDVTPIEVTIRHFMQFLDRMDLVDLYAEKWNLKNFYKPRSDK